MCQEKRSQVSAMLERTLNNELLGENDLYQMASKMMMMVPNEDDHQTHSYTSLSPSITPPIILSPGSLCSLNMMEQSEASFCVSDKQQTELVQTDCSEADNLPGCDKKNKGKCLCLTYTNILQQMEAKKIGDEAVSDEMVAARMSIEKCSGDTLNDVGSGRFSLLDKSARLNIDTNLANQQCSKQQKESNERKMILAKKIQTIIRNDDFEQFSSVLRYCKPDLNVFIDGQTALHYCLMMGRDVSWCKLLVLNGANPNICNQYGWHPLHLAAFHGHKESLRYLNSCNSCQNPPMSVAEPTTSTNVVDDR